MFTAYVVAFGGLLLLGGRLSDLFGARRLFSAGWVVLLAGSAVAGAAGTVPVELTGRAPQGTGAALIAPAALTLSALGLAAMTAIAASAGADQLGNLPALTDGFSAAFVGAGLIALAGAGLAAVTLRTPRPERPEAVPAASAAEREKSTGRDRRLPTNATNSVFW